MRSSNEFWIISNLAYILRGKQSQLNFSFSTIKVETIWSSPESLLSIVVVSFSKFDSVLPFLHFTPIVSGPVTRIRFWGFLVLPLLSGVASQEKDWTWKCRDFVFCMCVSAWSEEQRQPFYSFAWPLFWLLSGLNYCPRQTGFELLLSIWEAKLCGFFFFFWVSVWPFLLFLVRRLQGITWIIKFPFSQDGARERVHGAPGLHRHGVARCGQDRSSTAKGTSWKNS